MKQSGRFLFFNAIILDYVGIMEILPFTVYFSQPTNVSVKLSEHLT